MHDHVFSHTFVLFSKFFLYFGYIFCGWQYLHVSYTPSIVSTWTFNKLISKVIQSAVGQVIRSITVLGCVLEQISKMLVFVCKISWEIMGDIR